MEDIDIVVLWVDGGDAAWQSEKDKYLRLETGKGLDVAANRYRDWETMRYWFRGIETFAPWVRKVHFVTCGQKPEWLNEKCPKLHCVSHADYMPAVALPCFNSSAIEIGIHKIEGLANKFIYFNDDMFLLRKVKPELFFRGDVPVYFGSLHPIIAQGLNANGIMAHIMVNELQIINSHYDCKSELKKNRSKWFLPHKVGLKTALMNLLYSKHSAFIGFGNAHLPVPFLKKTLEEVWDVEKVALEGAVRHRFRKSEDLTQYLFRYWDMARGSFSPISKNRLGGMYKMEKGGVYRKIIERQLCNMICLQDADESYSEEIFDIVKREVIESFEKILPNKSDFEI